MSLEVEKSATSKRRVELMGKLEVPTISEAKSQLGPSLAKIIFEECDNDLKPDFGLEPLLEGPGDELWNSPSDLLIGKVCLKPPLTQKHIQALTHQGIIEIGGVIEAKFRYELDLEKDIAVAKKEDDLLRIFEIQKKKLIIEIRDEDEKKYLTTLVAIRRCHQTEIMNLIVEMVSQLQNTEELSMESMYAHESNDAQTNAKIRLFAEKLKQEANDVIAQLNADFIQRLEDQEQELTKLFDHRMKQFEINKKCAVEFERIKCAENLIQVKHQLHCQNLANLMYILCKERTRCRNKRDELKRSFHNELKKNQQCIQNKSVVIAKLRQKQKEKNKQLLVRETCLMEILRQYKKLIYFALKATPTQGEFLMKVDELLRYQLKSYCLSDKELPTIAAIKRAAEVLQQEETKRETREEPSPGEIGFVEKEVPVEDPMLGKPTEGLPVFYFNDKMYIREDFRDLMYTDGDLDMTKLPIWNPDVEELIDIFKKERKTPKVSIIPSDLNSGFIDAEVSNVLFELNSSEAVAKISSKMLSPTGSVKEIIAPEKEMPMVKSVDRRISYCRKERLSTNSVKLQDNIRGCSRLDMARDSVILRISSMEKDSLTDNNSASSMLSLELASRRTAHQRPSISKLVLASDSLELIKSKEKMFSSEKQRMSLDVRAKQKLANWDPNSRVPLDSRELKRKRESGRTPLVRTQRKSGLKEAHIAGNRSIVGISKPMEQFTEDRVKSLVSLMKENPSLLRLFTSCSK